MGFSTDYSNVGTGSDIIPKGTYECIIDTAKLSATQNGIPVFSVNFVVRNDIAVGGKVQPYANKLIFHNVWRKKEPSELDNAVGGFSFKQIMALAKGAGLPSGKDYATLDELGADLINKCCKITVEHEPSQKDGKLYPRVAFVNPTDYKECRHVRKQSGSPSPQQYAQPAQQGFAVAKPTSSVPNARTIPAVGDLSDFEEVISDSDLPFLFMAGL